MRDLFGFHKKAEQAAHDTPNFLIKAQEIAQTILMGTHAHKKTGSGESFWQYRNYQAGDRPQDIDWKRSAKSDTVYIRQKEKQTPQSVFIWIDENASMSFSSDKKQDTKFETAQTLCMALCILFERSGEKTSLLHAGRPGHGAKHLQDIANQISTLDCEGDTEEIALASYAGNLSANAQCILISDFWQPIEAIEKTVSTLRSKTNAITMLHICDPAEITLPYKGHTVFRNFAGGERIKIPNVSDIQKEYQERIQEHLRALAQLAQKNRWRYHRHQTDHDLIDTLRQRSIMLAQEERYA